MAVNLRLMKTAHADPAWKDVVEAAEQHLLKLGLRFDGTRLRAADIDAVDKVPVARLKGQLSFSLPEKLAESPSTALSLHTEAQLEGGRFKVEIIEPARKAAPTRKKRGAMNTD